MKIPHRRIGGDGQDVSVLSLGSWHIYDRMPFEDSVEMIRLAVDSGVNLFDVGKYGGFSLGDGKVIPESYTDVLFGRIMQAAGVAREDYALSAKLWLEGFPEHNSMEKQLDALLFRVGTDYADFSILGDIWTPGLDIPRLVGALGEVVASGKLRAWGVNNWSIEDLRAAHQAAQEQGVPGPRMAQFKYSVIRRSVAEGDPFRELREETGITMQASDVMEGGILAGNYKPERMIGRDPGGVQDAAPEAGRKLAEIAAGFGATAAQAAIAFCLTHPATTTVLFGASRVQQLKDNMGAVELAAKHGDELRAAVADLWLDRDLVDPSGRK